MAALSAISASIPKNQHYNPSIYKNQGCLFLLLSSGRGKFIFLLVGLATYLLQFYY